MNKFIISGFAVLLGVAAAPALAVPSVFGAATRLTERNCNGLAATVDCLGEDNPDPFIVNQLFAGGAGMTVNANFSPAGGGLVTQTIGYGALDLPLIRAFVQAGADNRVNTNATAYQSYLYSGAAATPFGITATIDFTSSGAPSVAGLGIDEAAPEIGGEAFSFVRLGLWDPSIVTGLVTAEDISTFGFGFACGDVGVFGEAQMRFATSGPGAGGGSITLATGCDGLPIVLTPGQEILVFALQQTPANRGGFLDATHTLRVGLGDNLTVEQKAVLTEGLVSARSLVPEPATWAMLITGFGLTGGAMRRRRPLAA